MNLSVVTVTYNSSRCVGSCLDAVARVLPEAERIVVDNASADDTRAIAEQAGAQVLARERNEGFGRACNAGAREAKREHVLFVNPDVELTAADADELEALFARRPFGLAGPMLSSGGHWLGDYFDNTLRALRPHELPAWEARSQDVNGHAAWASGEILLVRREEFLRLGGFDPRFFLYYEDRDLSARYREARLPITKTDAIAGTHLRGGSSEVEELRIGPHAWAFLGWLQYLYVHEGESSARRAAILGVETLRVIAGALAAGARLAPDGRIGRKHRQVGEVLAFVEARARDGADGFCPDARRLVAELL
jgi:N-acetylglucosaminyl-diphospho-decaprenol L-rhamnosyltransferase